VRDEVLVPTVADAARAGQIEAIAVDAYVVEIPGLDRAWAELNAEELEDIRDVLMSYLFLTRELEWT
jgi:hypothetical protein